MVYNRGRMIRRLFLVFITLNVVENLYCQYQRGRSVRERQREDFEENGIYKCLMLP